MLAAHVDGLRDELAGLGPEVGPLLDALATMLSGGKRLRAALCYWSWRAHGGTPDHGCATGVDATHVMRVGASLELFQAAALFHDDVMDASDLRRGRPAAHRVFEERHRERDWAGDPARFGESAAILLGDLALIASEREVSEALVGAAEPTLARARAVFDRMRTEVTVGQYLDVLAQALPWGVDPAVDERRARVVLRAKSARYSVEHPLSLGAALAGADDDALARCREVGLPLGEAFQLRDDLLGVYGDPSTTGKPAGDDLREGKRTVLVARAMAAADDNLRELLLRDLGRRDLTDGDVADLRDRLRDTGAVAGLEELIDDLARPALDALAAAPLAEDGRAMLLDLGRALVERSA
nr:polyprenyl synthetase family protein [Cellulomonas sp. APG4]